MVLNQWQELKVKQFTAKRAPFFKPGCGYSINKFTIAIMDCINTRGDISLIIGSPDIPETLREETKKMIETLHLSQQGQTQQMAIIAKRDGIYINEDKW